MPDELSTVDFLFVYTSKLQEIFKIEYYLAYIQAKKEDLIIFSKILCGFI